VEIGGSPTIGRVATDAETRMIDAGERIAAERGLGAMSLRAVQTAAGQRNKSAAHYHFGSREGLIEAIVTTRMAPTNLRRAEQLERLPEDPSLGELVDVLVRPTAEAVLASDPSYWARFVLAGVADPTVSRVVWRRIEGESFRQVRARIVDRLVHVPPALRSRRIDRVLGLAFLTLASLEVTPADRVDPTYVPELLAMCTAALEAPFPS
jgi:AcrR family transcriptional regulator